MPTTLPNSRLVRHAPPTFRESPRPRLAAARRISSSHSRLWVSPALADRRRQRPNPPDCKVGSYHGWHGEDEWHRGFDGWIVPCPKADEQCDCTGEAGQPRHDQHHLLHPAGEAWKPPRHAVHQSADICDLHRGASGFVGGGVPDRGCWSISRARSTRWPRRRPRSVNPRRRGWVCGPVDPPCRGCRWSSRLLLRPVPALPSHRRRR